MGNIQNGRSYRCTCAPCGEVLVGGSEDEVLDMVSQHAGRFHDVDILSVVSLHELRATIRSESELHSLMVKHLEDTGNLPPQRVSLLETKLHEREREVVQYITHGFSNKEIAKRLCISERTVSTHLENIYEKLDVHSKAGLVAMVRAADRVLEAGTRSVRVPGLEPFLPPASATKSSPVPTD